MSATLIALLLAAPAAPAPQPPSGTDTRDADAAARVETPAGADARYDFPDEGLKGEVLKDSGILVGAHAPAGFGSLITIRGTFTDHLVRQSHDMG